MLFPGIWGMMERRISRERQGRTDRKKMEKAAPGSMNERMGCAVGVSDMMEGRYGGVMRIASGDVVAEQLRVRYPGEEIVSFGEAMCEGRAVEPVFGPEFIRLRSLAYGVTEDMYRKKCPGEAVRRLAGRASVCVLYFDDDMFCVVNVITLLAYLEELGFKGDVVLYRLPCDGSLRILEEQPLALGKFGPCYRRVLVERRPFTTELTYFDSGIPLYLDYVREENDITRYIRFSDGLGETELMHRLMERFTEYGLTDLAALRFIRQVRGGSGI